jgi:hypothetical protein
MQLKQEFIRTCNKLGLEDCEVALAEVIWQRAERAAWGLSKQVPSLLDNKEQAFKQTTKLEIDMIEPEPSIELTQADLQVLTKIIALQIQRCQQASDYDKIVVQALWSKCDPDNPDSEHSFEALNYYKDMLRKNKQKRDKLAAMQHKLKKLQSFLGN